MKPPTYVTSGAFRVLAAATILNGIATILNGLLIGVLFVKTGS